MPYPTGLHRRGRRGGHLLMCLAWKYLSVMKVQIPTKNLLFCLPVCLSIYLYLILSLKGLPKVHLSFNGLWLQFNDVPITAYWKKQEKLSLMSRGVGSFALGWQSDTTIERCFTWYTVCLFRILGNTSRWTSTSWDTHNHVYIWNLGNQTGAVGEGCGAVLLSPDFPPQSSVLLSSAFSSSPVFFTAFLPPNTELLV